MQVCKYASMQVDKKKIMKYKIMQLHNYAISYLYESIKVYK